MAAILILSTLVVHSQENDGGVFGLGISDDASVAFSWKPNNEPDLAGYRLYVGTVPGVYAGYVEVGTATRVRLVDLIRGMRYFFALTAYNSSGLESDFTPELSAQIPFATPVTPAVEPVVTNEPPYFEPLPDLVLDEMTTNYSVLVLGVRNSLNITATSSSPELFPNPEVTFYSPEIAYLTLQTLPGATGTGTITVTADDGQGTNNLFSRSFSVTVEPLNSPPAISHVPDLWILKTRLAGPISFTVADAESTPASLEVTVTSSNPAVLPQSGLTLTGSGSSRALTIDPTNARFGVSTVTLTVSDGSATASVSFQVTILNLMADLLFGDAGEQFFQ
ncbi:MAG TPA: hypothetical protein VJ063_16535 [Verrucomicrobiae bacterium]|nr:hypothetical protein [Verrucomicrobiae bacterium]